MSFRGKSNHNTDMEIYQEQKGRNQPSLHTSFFPIQLSTSSRNIISLAIANSCCQLRLSQNIDKPINCLLRRAFIARVFDGIPWYHIDLTWNIRTRSISLCASSAVSLNPCNNTYSNVTHRLT